MKEGRKGVTQEGEKDRTEEGRTEEKEGWKDKREGRKERQDGGGMEGRREVESASGLSCAGRGRCGVLS